MSLYGMMRTGVSGMSAQANRLSTVADNIANAGTNGYTRSRADFSTLVIPTELKNVGALLVLIVVLLFRPQGILGRAERIG